MYIYINLYVSKFDLINNSFFSQFKLTQLNRLKYFLRNSYFIYAARIWIFERFRSEDHFRAQGQWLKIASKFGPKPQSLEWNSSAAICHEKIRPRFLAEMRNYPGLHSGRLCSLLTECSQLPTWRLVGAICTSITYFSNTILAPTG